MSKAFKKFWKLVTPDKEKSRQKNGTYSSSSSGNFQEQGSTVVHIPKEFSKLSPEKHKMKPRKKIKEPQISSSNSSSAKEDGENWGKSKRKLRKSTDKKQRSTHKDTIEQSSSSELENSNSSDSSTESEESVSDYLPVIDTTKPKTKKQHTKTTAKKLESTSGDRQKESSSQNKISPDPSSNKIKIRAEITPGVARKIRFEPTPTVMGQSLATYPNTPLTSQGIYHDIRAELIKAREEMDLLQEKIGARYSNMPLTKLKLKLRESNENPQQVNPSSYSEVKITPKSGRDAPSKKNKLKDDTNMQYTQTIPTAPSPDHDLYESYRPTSDDPYPRKAKPEQMDKPEHMDVSSSDSNNDTAFMTCAVDMTTRHKSLNKTLHKTGITEPNIGTDPHKDTYGVRGTTQHSNYIPVCHSSPIPECKDRKQIVRHTAPASAQNMSAVMMQMTPAERRLYQHKPGQLLQNKITVEDYKTTKPEPDVEDQTEEFLRYIDLRRKLAENNKRRIRDRVKPQNQTATNGGPGNSPSDSSSSESEKEDGTNGTDDHRRGNNDDKRRDKKNGKDGRHRRDDDDDDDNCRDKKNGKDGRRRRDDDDYNDDRRRKKDGKDSHRRWNDDDDRRGKRDGTDDRCRRCDDDDCRKRPSDGDNRRRKKDRKDDRPKRGDDRDRKSRDNGKGGSDSDPDPSDSSSDESQSDDDNLVRKRRQKVKGTKSKEHTIRFIGIHGKIPDIGQLAS